MSDRAAPMSSEEAAKQAVIDSVAQFALAIAREGEAEWHPDSLDTYKEHIERRVLAQQPCYTTTRDGYDDCAHRNECEGGSGLCNPCTARAAQTLTSQSGQTQETSG